jgi:hypothetical protein
VNNTSREENVPINEMHTEDVQGSMPSIGTALVALCRTTLGTSNRREKLVRERGAGSKDFISKFFGILTTMERQTYYRGL